MPLHEVKKAEQYLIAAQKISDQSATYTQVEKDFSKIAEHLPGLILLDWMLPDVSGLELLRRWKRKESFQEIPIIMLTANSQIDGFGHIVIGAEFERFDNVFALAVGRQHNDWKFSRRMGFTDGFKNSEAVHVWHHDIE